MYQALKPFIITLAILCDGLFSQIAPCQIDQQHPQQLAFLRYGGCDLFGLGIDTHQFTQPYSVVAVWWCPLQGFNTNLDFPQVSL